MSRLHLYRAKEQPAYRYRDYAAEDAVNKPGKRKQIIWRDIPLYAFVYCFNCEKKRRAYNAVVQVYYDGVYAFCRRGFGCRKDDRV